jgi:hypothetical protein
MVTVNDETPLQVGPLCLLFFTDETGHELLGFGRFSQIFGAQ